MSAVEQSSRADYRQVEIDALVRQIANRDGDYLAALDELEGLARRTAPQVDVQVDVSRRPARFIQVRAEVWAPSVGEHRFEDIYLAVDHITEVEPSRDGLGSVINCGGHTYPSTKSVGHVMQLIDGESRRA